MRRHQFPGWRVPRAHPVRGQARDDLEGWNPDQFPPNQNGECETRTITTPDEFQINTCHETQNIAKKQCYREANVTTYTEDVLSDKTSVHVIVNHNSPADPDYQPESWDCGGVRQRRLCWSDMRLRVHR